MNPRHLLQAAALLALSAGGAVCSHLFHPHAPAWYLRDETAGDHEITWEQVRDELGGDVLWLDARPAERFQTSRIPGARPLTEQAFDEQLFDLLDAIQTNIKPVVIYCDGGDCKASHRVRERLVESLPLERVLVLKGGAQPSMLLEE
jgi:rhodanese-related sulfurtransferase